VLATPAALWPGALAARLCAGPGAARGACPARVRATRYSFQRRLVRAVHQGELVLDTSVSTGAACTPRMPRKISILDYTNTRDWHECGRAPHLPRCTPLPRRAEPTAAAPAAPQAARAVPYLRPCSSGSSGVAAGHVQAASCSQGAHTRADLAPVQLADRVCWQGDGACVQCLRNRREAGD